MDVTINNRCANIELTSPVWLIKDATCPIQFPQQVESNRIMKTNFATGIDRDTFGGAFLYRLQREKNVGSDKDISTSTQLLVIWGYKFGQPHSYVCLIEHESTLPWNEDELEKLCAMHDNRYEACSNIYCNGWLLNDNTVVEIMFEPSHEGFEIDIIISEGENLPSHRKPLWIDSNR
jgi:hypothetical protein